MDLAKLTVAPDDEPRFRALMDEHHHSLPAWTAMTRMKGSADTDLPVLRRMGCAAEIVSLRTRVFAPNAVAIERILERWPLAA